MEVASEKYSVGVDANHMEICRFRSKDDPKYRDLLEYIREIVDYVGVELSTSSS